VGSVKAIYNPHRKILRIQRPDTSGFDILREQADLDIPNARWEIGWRDDRLALVIDDVEPHVRRRDKRRVPRLEHVDDDR
jgi:hypothetical protein